MSYSQGIKRSAGDAGLPQDGTVKDEVKMRQDVPLSKWDILLQTLGHDLYDLSIAEAAFAINEDAITANKDTCLTIRGVAFDSRNKEIVYAMEDKKSGAVVITQESTLLAPDYARGDIMEKSDKKGDTILTFEVAKRVGQANGSGSRWNYV